MGPEDRTTVADPPRPCRLAASDATGRPDGSPFGGHIAIWRARTGAPVTTALKVAAAGNDVAFSRDGRRLAVALGDGRVLILDSSKGTQIRTIHPLEGDNGGIVSLAFAPNETLATGTYAGVVQLWNPSTGAPISHPVLVAAAPVASIARLQLQPRLPLTHRRHATWGRRPL